MRIPRALVTVAALFLVLGTGSVLPAAAELTSSIPADRERTGVVRVQGREHVVAADLAEKINSGDWRDLSMEQLARAGIYPGMTALDGSGPIAKVQEHGEGITPQSAFGCNLAVCIYVFGALLHVNDWDTSAANSTYRCSYAAYWAGGSVIATTNSVCASGDFWAFWGINRSFSNNTQLCNTWIGISGRPCIRVHS